MSSYIHAGTAYGGHGQKIDARTPVTAPSKNISRCGASALLTGKAIVQEAGIVRPGTGVNRSGTATIAVIHRRGTGIGST